MKGLELYEGWGVGFRGIAGFRVRDFSAGFEDRGGDGYGFYIALLVDIEPSRSSTCALELSCLVLGKSVKRYYSGGRSWSIV